MFNLIPKVADYIVILAMLSFVAYGSYSFFKEDVFLGAIVVDMAPTKAFEYNEGVWSTDISGIKVRDCILIRETILGLIQENGKWRETHFEFTNTTKRPISRPIGKQDFATWNWSGSIDATKTKIVVEHLCNGKNIVETVIGPFTIQN
jgi:hypothetical protein